MNEDAVQTKSVEIKLGYRSYTVHIGSGLLDHVGRACRQVGLGSRALLITNETVGPLYEERVVKSLEKEGFTVASAHVADGEQHKTLATVEHLYHAGVGAQLDRGSFVVALGGGVVGDIAGFTAATYMRGIPFVQVPTTLLAQVDASVGGKTGVNLAAGKNLIGAFHQPRLVIADLDTLTTLPAREYVSGLAEVVKHGLIADSDLYTYCERERRALSNRSAAALQHVVVRSIEIKAEVVAEDETERGLRAILNYGHTVGHGIEAVTRYERYLHGEAIAIGMAVEGRLSVALGTLSSADYARSLDLLSQLNLPISPGDLDEQAVLAAMKKDKKVHDGHLRFALLKTLGRAEVVDSVAESAVLRAYRECGSGSDARSEL